MNGSRAERALVLAPLGRDAALACAMLAEAGYHAEKVADLAGLIAAIDEGAGFALVTEEALGRADAAPLAAWLEEQPPWSDFPFILLTERGGVERNPAAARYLDLLGNVTFVERPFHPTTLISLAKAALRGRRRQYEAQARLDVIAETGARYKTLFESIDQGFCIIEFIDGPHGPLSDYIHVEANPAYARHAGIPDIIGKRLREIVGEEADTWAALYREVLLTGRAVRFENELIETHRTLEVFSFRVEPESRRQVAVLFQDISARKRAELALRDLNETLEARVAAAIAEQKILADIVETTESFVNVVDLDMRWLAMNRAARTDFERVFGVAPRVGDSVLAALEHLPEQREQARKVWERVFAGKSFTLTGDFGDPARERPFYELRYSPLRDAGGEIIGGFVIGEDITARKRQEAALAEAQEALRQAQKMEAIGQLTGGVAHDFNNMLTVIRSSADLLKRPNLAPERRDLFLNGIAETADRAAKLTQQLLAFSRQAALKPEVFDARGRVHGIAEMLSTLVGSRIKLTIEAPSAPLIVAADIAQFETAIVNLCVNARDAMDGEGALRIALDQADDHIRVTVSDTGTGIAPEALPRIFDPFFTTKPIGKGTGLGLSQVYGFAKQSGGDLRVESEVGQGTRVFLLLPRSADPVSGASVPELDPVASQGGRILVVEDNDDVRGFVSQVLSDLGFEVELAASADEALARLAREDRAFHLVFSDVVMQGMDGIALAREIAARWPELPVLLTTGYSETLAEDGRQAFPLLAKPYASDALARAIAEARAAKAAALAHP